MSNRLLRGEVISAKMQKTVVVKVVVTKRHPKYHKRFSVSRKYKAHSETDEYKVGDLVEIRETRPKSKEKRWVVVRKIK